MKARWCVSVYFPAPLALEDATQDPPSLHDLLARIHDCGNPQMTEIAPQLAHAFAGCLTDNELCEAVAPTLRANAFMRSVLLAQLFRRAKNGLDAGRLDGVVTSLTRAGEEEPKLRVKADAILSHIYPMLVPPTREMVLELWRTRGLPGSTSRWLKAISTDELLFSFELITAYWRATRDYRAAKTLADRAEPARVSDLLPEMIETCDEGWIIQRAALRASLVPESAWQAIRQRFPATFAYLCARTRRAMTEADAYEIIADCEPDVDGLRGLAVWSVGQLGMSTVLERVYAEAMADKDSFASS